MSNAIYQGQQRCVGRRHRKICVRVNESSYVRVMTNVTCVIYAID